MAVRSGVACPWGPCCKFGLLGPGVCTGVHSADDERHFEGKREGRKREVEAACAYCVMGTCRFGSSCRRGIGGDSDYESQSSGTDVDGAEEEPGPPARALRPTARARTPRSLHLRSRSGFRKVWSRPAKSSDSAGSADIRNYYAPLQADFMGNVIGNDEENEDEYESEVEDGLVEGRQAAAAGAASTTPGGAEEDKSGDRVLEDDRSWLQKARARARSGAMVRKGGWRGSATCGIVHSQSARATHSWMLPLQRTIGVSRCQWTRGIGE